MEIASPKESVYYYECSNGHFRLFYFIPPGELKGLCDKQSISPKVLEDFPDGVDLGCTEADFKEFKDTYAYTIPLDPNALCRAFYAVFSTTHDWENFRGSGFIPAADLERHLEAVDEALLRDKKMQEDIKPPLSEMSLKQHRQRKHQQAVLQRQTEEVLREFQVKGIKPDLNMAQQKFTSINMAEGVGAEEVFIRLHQKKRKE